MSYDFPLILFYLLLASIVIGGLDKYYFAKKRLAAGIKKGPWIAEFFRSYFSVFLIVWVIRTFIAQPFVVPTGSLKPTVMPGDFTLATQFSFGLHLPVWDKKLIPTWMPKRGDIVLLHWPVNPRIDFVKRMIGLPGDRISYINKVLYINGKKMPQKYVRNARDSDGVGEPSWPVKVYQENLDGVVHDIYRNPKETARNFVDLVVPKGMYFVMGDNRDNSDDSRDWGFVPSHDLIGKGQMIIFSWDSATHRPRWHRIGNKL